MILSSIETNKTDLHILTWNNLQKLYWSQIKQDIKMEGFFKKMEGLLCQYFCLKNGSNEWG